MTRKLKRRCKKALIKQGWGPDARKLLYEFVWRQEHGLDWDNNPCYGVGYGLYQDLLGEIIPF